MHRRPAVWLFLFVLLTSFCWGDQVERSTYIPKDLNDCFRVLKKTLDPKVLQKMKTGKEDDMIEYHFGLGMGIRNGWGLWKGSRLSKWFNKKGIRHPDDMSGIILDSFWRHLHNKPIKLEEQIKHYQDYWKQVKVEDKRENERIEKVRNKIRSMMIGLVVPPGKPQSVALPTRQNGGQRARYLAAYNGGVLLNLRNGFDEKFTTPGYFLNLQTNTIHPIVIPELDTVHYSAVAGGAAYFCGLKDSEPVLVAVSKSGRSKLVLPLKVAVPQLGINGDKVMAVYPTSVYELDSGGWQKIATSKQGIPKSGPPPRKFGDMILFRDEGTNECDKRLWKLDVGSNPKLMAIDDETGLTGSSGPRWESCSSYAMTLNGDLWVALGDINERMSLLKRSSNAQYSIGTINSRLQLKGDLIDEYDGSDSLSISTLTTRKDSTLLLAGYRGIYLMDGKQLTKIVSFSNTSQEIPIDGGKNLYHWSWDPSDVLELPGGGYIISGMFGGIYRIERITGGAYRVISLDEKLGEPIRL